VLQTIRYTHFYQRRNSHYLLPASMLLAPPRVVTPPACLSELGPSLEMAPAFFTCCGPSRLLFEAGPPPATLGPAEGWEIFLGPFYGQFFFIFYGQKTRGSGRTPPGS